MQPLTKDLKNELVDPEFTRVEQFAALSTRAAAISR